MKKLVVIAIAALLTVPVIGCKDDGNDLSSLLGLESGSDPSASMYIEYLYDNDNGKRLTDQAISGMPSSEELNEKVGKSMRARLIESLGQSTENPESPNWWERLDVDSKEISSFLETSEGKQMLVDYLGNGGEKKANILSSTSDPGLAKSMSGDSGDIMDSFGYFNDFAPIGVVHFAFVDGLFYVYQEGWGEIDTRRLLFEGFELVLYKLDEMEEWLKSQPLEQAKNTINAKVTSFANLSGYDESYRRTIIKDYFINEHEVLFEQAFNSALEITETINSRPESVEPVKIPGNMLYSHMVFMRQMSEMRLSYAPYFYNRNSLLRFRANWAKSDLIRLKKIKDAFLSDDRMEQDLGYFNDVCALLASWEIVLRAHIETYYGRDVRDIELEDAANIDADRAFGTFGDLNDLPGSGICGETMSDDSGAPLTGLFNYGDSLESVFDTSTSGSLDGGKFIRMVHSGRNLLSDLGLTPVAKRLLHAEEMTGAPGKGQFFIDPATGRYILPRPVYWSRMDSEDEILNPVIGNGTPVFEQEAHYNVYYEPGMWGGNSLRLYSANRFAGTNYLHPFGSGHVVNTGAMSFWTYMTKSSLVTLSLRIHFGGANNYFEIKDDTIVLFINGVSVHERNFDLVNTGSWHHVYLAWDRDAGLAGGLCLRLFIDGGEHQISVADPWTMGGYYLAFRISATAGCSANIYLDNLKIWNHVVTEDPSFEWNEGAGRENALHVIYGPDADPEYDYRPKLTGSGNGVGYYFMP